MRIKFLLHIRFNLDLRWNNIGLVGAKGLLAALKKNHTLTQLQVTGNNIPEDLADSISKFFGRIFYFKIFNLKNKLENNNLKIRS